MKYLIFILALVFLIGIVGASQESLGVFQQGKCINLIQTCSNCSFVNITSILYPNSTQLLGNSVMTATGSVYNYSLCSASVLGIYTVNGIGNPNGVDEIWIYDFEVTPTGNKLNIEQAMLYTFMLIVMIGLFAFSLLASIKIQGGNSRNSYDEVIKINWKKYMKLFAGGLSYVFLLWIVYLAWNLSYGYLQMRGLGMFFRYVFTILMGLALPVFAGFIILSAVAYVNDKKLQGLINKGIPFNESY